MKRYLLAALFAVGILGVAQAVVLTGTNNLSQDQVLKAGFFRMSMTNTITALAGGAQAGTAIVSGYNRVTTVATGGDSVQLPVCLSGGAPDTVPPSNSDGLFLIISNTTATSMNVFPQTGGTVANGSTNAGFALAANKTAAFICSGSNAWYVISSALP
jgi:hypothetical protein